MIRTGEIEEMLKLDSWEKKRAGHGKYRSRGAMRTPVDLLTGQSKKDYQEKTYVNLSKIRSFKEFNQLEEPQKIKVLKKWQKQFTLDQIYEFQGWNPVLFFKQIKSFNMEMNDFAQRRIMPLQQQEEQTQENKQNNELMTYEEFKRMDENARHEFLVKERGKYGNHRLNEKWGKNKTGYYLHQNYTVKNRELPKINNVYVSQVRMNSRNNTNKLKYENLINPEKTQEENYEILLEDPSQAKALFLTLSYDRRAKLLNIWLEKYKTKGTREITGWATETLSKLKFQLKSKGFTFYPDNLEEKKEQTQPMKEESKQEKTKISDWIHDVPVTALPPEPKAVPIAADGFQTSYKKSSVHAADAAKRLRMLANLIEESGGLFQLSIDISELEQKSEVLALGEPPAEEKEESAITEQDLKLLKLLKELQGV